MTNGGIKQKTVVAQVMEEIKSLIANGQYKANDRIPTESQLAEKFGIGRSSVREAVKIFQHLGVLETRSSKGTFVCGSSKISKEALTWAILLGERDLFEMVDLRSTIEHAGLTQIVRDLGRDPSSVAPILADLKNALERMENAPLDVLGRADYDFHGTIIRGSRNSIFIAIYSTLQAFMQEEIRKCIEMIVDFDELFREHANIYHAIESGSLSEGLAALSLHIDRVRLRLERSLASSREQP